MTSPEGRRDRAQPVHIALRRTDAGTLLGALAWVLGALQIMRDRGHYEDDEEFHALYDELSPRLERLVGQVVEARQSSITRPEFEEGIEQAYADIRRAFEAWIQLTAADTLSAAVAARLEHELPEDAGSAEGAPEPD
jgi:hypothetical protein